jgi:Raf kinase inhibitor-like YbhB/YbcL family protein
MRRCVLAVLIALALPGAATTRASAATKTIAVTAHAFGAGGRIPQPYAAVACGGKNLSPQLSWGKLPGATQSVALTVFDPDAGGGAGFWHWIVYDMPAQTRGLVSSADGKTLPRGSVTSENGARTRAYFGPCPPHGPPHHYRFTVYALDAPYLQIKPGSRPEAVLARLGSRILGSGTLLGVFGR